MKTILLVSLLFFGMLMDDYKTLYYEGFKYFVDRDFKKAAESLGKSYELKKLDIPVMVERLVYKPLNDV